MSKLTKNKRLLLFWSVCVTARLLLVLFAKSINIVYLPILGILGIMGGIGFGVQYYRNAGGAFGQRSWWNKFRPVHSVFYLVFGVLCLLKIKWAYLILLLDLLFGVSMFVKNYYI